eukprot:Skav231724  [mRNA]  locus=scaffold2515:198891:199634:- [translate_table: standard]
MTHDYPTEEIDRKGFLTPLTELQELREVADEATLPRSLNHRRFNYPHTLSYKALGRLLGIAMSIARTLLVQGAQVVEGLFNGLFAPSRG